MKFEIHNTGTEPITLSNGSILAPGEVSAMENSVITIGQEAETTLKTLSDKVHALEQRIVGYFEPASHHETDQGASHVA